MPLKIESFCAQTLCTKGRKCLSEYLKNKKQTILREPVKNLEIPFKYCFVLNTITRFFLNVQPL